MSEGWTPPPIGSPCWFEIPAEDVPATKEFYGKLFPSWEWRPATEKYTADKIAMFQFAGPNSLSGGIVHREGEKDGAPVKNTGVILYHIVKSVDETKEYAESLGAKALTGKVNEGDSGYYIQLQDVAGNRFGIYEFKG